MNKLARRLNFGSRLSPARGWRALRHLFYGTPFYGFTLIGKTPGAVRGTPPDPWPGDVSAGQALVDGAFIHGGRRVSLGDDPWGDASMRQSVAGALHGFAWLGDLAILGSPEAARRAHTLTEAWLQAHGRWSAGAWRAHTLGERLANWLVHGNFLERAGGPDFHGEVLRSAARQARHLGRVAASARRDWSLFLAIKGLVYSGVCLPGFENGLEAGLRLLHREIDRQILPDGGHSQRNPALQLAVLRHLVDIRGCLGAVRVEVPGELQGAIDRMAPMLRSFRHGDGRLALFNYGNEEDEGVIDMVLAQAGAKGRPISSAPHSGFQRLAAGKTLILMEAGAPVAAGDDRVHAGALSFEMSVGKDRLVVNCGAEADAEADAEAEWHEALRATAAHSSLVVDDTNSTELPGAGGAGAPAAVVLCNRREADGNIWIESSHDGYVGRFGLTHGRQLYLSVDGGDLRGLDTLTGEGGRAFAVRFHLHPEVRASMVQDGEAVLIRLPRGGGWHFHCSGGILALEESIYGGRAGVVRRCALIVISGPLAGDGAVIKWRFARIEA